MSDVGVAGGGSCRNVGDVCVTHDAGRGCSIVPTINVVCGVFVKVTINRRAGVLQADNCAAVIIDAVVRRGSWNIPQRVHAIDFSGKCFGVVSIRTGVIMAVGAKLLLLRIDFSQADGVCQQGCNRLPVNRLGQGRDVNQVPTGIIFTAGTIRPVPVGIRTDIATMAGGAKDLRRITGNRGSRQCRRGYWEGVRAITRDASLIMTA